MSEEKPNKRLTKQIIESLMAGVETGSKKAKPKPVRIPTPDLPNTQEQLSKSDQWRSLIWMIDTAEAHGENALQGLTILLARKIQSDGLSMLFFDARPHRSPDMRQEDLLWPADQPLTHDGKTLGHLVLRKQGPHHVELSSTAFIANVWEPRRLANSLQTIGPDTKQQPWKQDRNHHPILWYPWPLIWIDKGNHSTTAAAIRGGGTLVCDDVFDLSPLIGIISTDGINWYGENGFFVGPVESLPMAGIIEIGRRLLK